MLITSFFLSMLTYTMDIQPIFKQRCAQCHDYMSDKDWSKYEITKAKAEQIRTRVYILGDMPPGNTTHITDDERNTIRLWVEQGANK